MAAGGRPVGRRDGVAGIELGRSWYGLVVDGDGTDIGMDVKKKKEDPASLKALGIFSLCLGIAAIGFGALSVGMISFQKAMFSSIEDMDPNFHQGAETVDFLDEFE